LSCPDWLLERKEAEITEKKKYLRDESRKNVGPKSEEETISPPCLFGINVHSKRRRDLTNLG